MIVKPVGHNVLVRPFADETMYAGTIHLPDTAKRRASEGVVISTGEWCNNVLPGDWVVFSARQGVDVISDNLQHIIVDERAILVVIEEEEDATADQE